MGRVLSRSDTALDRFVDETLNPLFRAGRHGPDDPSQSAVNSRFWASLDDPREFASHRGWKHFRMANFLEILFNLRIKILTVEH